MPRPRAAAVALAAALAALSGCAAPARPKPAPPRVLSAQQRTADDQDFYRAVTAYVQGDYAQADLLLGRILRKDPRNRDAWALRRRVLSAERLSSSR